MATPNDQSRRQGDLPLVHYETPECVADLAFDPTNETLWATQQQIASAFGISSSTVRGHLATIFKEGELDEKSVAREFRATAQDGKYYRYLHYSLDAILSASLKPQISPTRQPRRARGPDGLPAVGADRRHDREALQPARRRSR
jgi:hypothetical protein